MNNIVDYKGFGEHLQDIIQLGLPIDYNYLCRLAKQYNTPIPGQEEYKKIVLMKTYQDFKKKFDELRLQPSYMIEPEHYWDCIEGNEETDMVLKLNGEPIEKYSEFNEFVITNLGPFDFYDDYANQRSSDTINKIIYFKDYDLYVKFSCWYNSYAGYDFDSASMEHVILKEKTVIFYERAN